MGITKSEEVSSGDLLWNSDKGHMEITKGGEKIFKKGVIKSEL